MAAQSDKAMQKKWLAFYNACEELEELVQRAQL